MFWLEFLLPKVIFFSQQNVRHFITNSGETKVFLDPNYVMGVNHLPSISMYWDYDHFIGNNDMENIFTKGRYQEIMQNLHFADNSKKDQTNKSCKICSTVDHLNKAFQSYSNEPKRSTDEHITKFKRRSSMRQYLKMKPIQWGFKHI